MSGVRRVPPFYEPRARWAEDVRAELARLDGVSGGGGTPEAPASPALLNGWTDYGAPYAPARYFRHNGIAYLAGGIVGGTVAAIAFYLPAGYRPDGVLRFGVDAAGAHGIVEVDAGGGVTPLAGAAGIWLDGISFRIGG